MAGFRLASLRHSRARLLNYARHFTLNTPLRQWKDSLVTWKWILGRQLSKQCIICKASPQGPAIVRLLTPKSVHL